MKLKIPKIFKNKKKPIEDAECYFPLRIDLGENFCNFFYDFIGDVDDSYIIDNILDMYTDSYSIYSDITL